MAPLLLLLPLLSLAADFHDPSPVRRIAFASCSHQDREQPLWGDIARWDPDYFIWLGDAVYTDTRIRPFSWKRPSISRYAEQLHKMKHSPGYESFRGRRTKILGVWDDHDYGVNDGGASDKIYTSAVQDMFLDFLDEPESSPRRTRKGLYGSYLFGSGSTTIKLILLDPRSQLDREAQSVLGPDQWAWLDAELRNDPTTLTIVGTGLPLLTDRSHLDKWLLYPMERERLLGLLSRRPSTIVLSGDSHFAEMQCSNTTRGPLFEVQSSGMTHNCLDWIPDLLCKYYIKYVSECPGCITEPYIDLNYGALTLMWNEESPGSPARVVMEVRGRSGVEIHYVMDLSTEAGERGHCPPSHKVEYQIVWQLCAVTLLCLTFLLIFYLGTYLIISIYARIVVYRRFDKPHPD